MSYEDEFGEALRRTGEEFSTDQRALVEGGHERGRRMVRRRRATVFGGAAAVVALGVTSAVVLPGIGGDPLQSASPAGSAESAQGADGSEKGKAVRDGESADSEKDTREGGPAGGHVRAEQLIATLKSLMPKGQFSEETGLGTESGAIPHAKVVFDDGKGKAAVGIGFNRLSKAEVQSGLVKDMTTCPDENLVPYDACEVSTLSDGSRLMTFKGYEHSSDKGGTKFWQAVLASPDGHAIDVGERNAPAEKGSAVTRPEPPLSMAQLKDILTSEKWDAVFAAPRVEGTAKPGSEGADAGKDGSGKADPGRTDPGKGGTAGNDAPATPDGQAVRSTLLALLPAGVKVTAQGGDGEYAYVVVDDGNGASMIQINVQPNMDDVRGELFAGAEELPDGTVYSWRESDGDKGVAGTVMWTADTLRPDGLRVVVSAFNSGTQHDAPSRKTPALTEEQLKAIATSAKWAELQ
ncbi:hypothetical protein H9Y04_35630 [Streptomyces sp. TRM66268-LWL]|uniref:LigA protein n=1 Tax=Streptomyces polyasparticus TaxID=2767826 RepID=A0ABR7SQV2_9ACTN|nr:hypothetical protein [Streptomyces polyasparticus]MBC9717875.1 hypothetical protein [Streptomyces polyasparticus]